MGVLWKGDFIKSEQTAIPEARSAAGSASSMIMPTGFSWSRAWSNNALKAHCGKAQAGDPAMQPDLEREAERLLLDYRRIFKSMDRKAAAQTSGTCEDVVRSVKGQRFAGLTERLITLAWSRLGADDSRLELNSQKHKIPMESGYLKKLDGETRAHILASAEEYAYPVNVDKQILVDGKLVMGIECMNHTGNAMLKRILADFKLLKSVFPELRCHLFQLESQLGGDYSAHNEITYGSKSTLTLMSHFPDVDLKIFTFLKGERKVDRPIHKPEFFKPLEKGRVLQAIDLLADDLAQHAGR